MKTNATLSADTERRILVLLDNGGTPSAIAAQVGLHPRRVDDVARQYGWPDPIKVADALAAFDAEKTDQVVGAGLPASSRELVSVSPDDLTPDPDNPREHLDGIEELADSIAAAGLLQPIVARRRGGRLIIVAGHRRHAAVKLLGLQAVDVVVTRDMAPDQVLAAMLIENGQRAGLDPIEEARALLRLKAQHNANSADIGRQVGRHQTWVDQRLALLELPLDVQEKVRAGQIGISAAADQARINSGRHRGAMPQQKWHLTDGHALATKVRNRCQKVHGKARLVGKVGCGECWEEVIRADERRVLQQNSATTGRCALCQKTTVDEHDHDQAATA